MLVFNLIYFEYVQHSSLILIFKLFRFIFVKISIVSAISYSTSNDGHITKCGNLLWSKIYQVKEFIKLLLISCMCIGVFSMIVQQAMTVLLKSRWCAKMCMFWLKLCVNVCFAWCYFYIFECIDKSLYNLRDQSSDTICAIMKIVIQIITKNENSLVCKK